MKILAVLIVSLLPLACGPTLHDVHDAAPSKSGTVTGHYALLAHCTVIHLERARDPYPYFFNLRERADLQTMYLSAKFEELLPIFGRGVPFEATFKQADPQITRVEFRDGGWYEGGTRLREEVWPIVEACAKEVTTPAK